MKEDLVFRVLEGAVDVHHHAAPCLASRRQTILENANDAKRMGVKGFVVKDHHFSTAPHAKIFAEIMPEIKVVGGVVMGASVGGINPRVVESTLKLGGKVVWMPSLESKWMIEMMGKPGFGSAEVFKKLGVDFERGGYSILDDPNDASTVSADVKEIIDLVKQYDAVLETGHLSKMEAVALIKQALKQGHKKIVVTHANLDITLYTAEEQKELCELGAYIMYSLAQYMPKRGNLPPDIGELKPMIDAVGCDHIVLGTDLGRYENPPPMEGLRMFIANLAALGYGEQDLRTMSGTNSTALYLD